MALLKVSAKYWNGLNTASQAALSDLAYKYGLQYAKRVVTLANKHFPTFAAIAPLSHYRPELDPIFTNGVFMCIDANNTVLGTIYKGSGIGITERVKHREIAANGEIGYTEVWHN